MIILFTLFFDKNIRLMKIIAKTTEVDLTPSPLHISTDKFMDNLKVKDILYINSQQIALVRTSSVIIFEPSTSNIIRTIQLQFSIDELVYNPQANCFYAYQHKQTQVISFANEGNPAIQPLYNISQNKGNIKFEWPPFILFFEKSENLILIRKIYGQSLIIIFKTSPNFQKLWQFTCNESSLSKIDQYQYLVNYSERNNKCMVKFEIYNCTLQHRSNYKVQNVEKNICKGVKLYQKVLDVDRKVSRTWLKIMIGVNFRVRGSGILLVNVLEGSDDQYHHIATVMNSDSEIHKILNASATNQSIQVLQFQYFQEERETKLFLTNYAWNNQETDLVVTDSKQVSSELQDFAFNQRQLQLITFSNAYSKPNDDSYDDFRQNISMNFHRFISKKMAYIHLMQQFSKNNQFTRIVCQLL